VKALRAIHRLLSALLIVQFAVLVIFLPFAVFGLGVGLMLGIVSIEALRAPLDATSVRVLLGFSLEFVGLLVIVTVGSVIDIKDE
jgi:D-alanyl-lipoteichoic acid acyltransferase DltB (MBOAT superfamily)